MDTHESTAETSANQMLSDVMNMRKEADESVYHEYNINSIAWMLYCQNKESTSQFSFETTTCWK